MGTNQDLHGDTDSVVYLLLSMHTGTIFSTQHGEVFSKRNVPDLPSALEGNCMVSIGNDTILSIGGQRHLARVSKAMRVVRRFKIGAGEWEVVATTNEREYDPERRTPRVRSACGVVTKQGMNST